LQLESSATAFSSGLQQKINNAFGGAVNSIKGLFAAEQTKGERPSTEEKHQKVEARKKLDSGKEKGDSGRRPPLQRPPEHKGPWPPKSSKGDGEVNKN
jgi:hypothetical protein